MTNLTVLRGNPGNRKPPGKTGGRTGRPSPPATLKGEAFAEWSRITTFLEKVGHIETIDYAALVIYCTAWSSYIEAHRAVEEHGVVVRGRDGAIVKNPAFQVMRDSSDTMLKFGGRFGFTPKDRQALGITTEGEEDDELESFTG